MPIVRFIAENPELIGARAMRVHERMRDADVGDFFEGMPKEIVDGVGSDLLVHMTGNIFRRRALRHVLRGDGAGQGIAWNVNEMRDGRDWRPPRLQPMAPAEIEGTAFQSLLDAIRVDDTRGVVTGVLVPSPFPVDEVLRRQFSQDPVYWEHAAREPYKEAVRTESGGSTPPIFRFLAGPCISEQARSSGRKVEKVARRGAVKRPAEESVAGADAHVGRHTRGRTGRTSGGARPSPDAGTQTSLRECWAQGNRSNEGDASGVRTERGTLAGEAIQPQGEQDAGEHQVRGLRGGFSPEAAERGRAPVVGRAELVTASGSTLGAMADQWNQDRGKAGPFITVGGLHRRRWAASSIGMAKTVIGEPVCGEDSCLVESIGMVALGVVPQDLPTEALRRQWRDRVRRINTSTRRLFCVPEGRGLDMDVAPWIIDAWLMGSSLLFSIYVVETSQEIDGYFMYLDSMHLLTPSRERAVLCIHYSSPGVNVGGHYAPIMPARGHVHAVMEAPPAAADVPVDTAQLRCKTGITKYDELLQAAAINRLSMGVQSDKRSIAAMATWLWLVQAGIGTGAPETMEGGVARAVTTRRALCVKGVGEVLALVRVALKEAKRCCDGGRGADLPQIPAIWVLDFDNGHMAVAAGSASRAAPVIIIRASATWWPALHDPIWSLGSEAIACRSALLGGLEECGLVRPPEARP